MAKLITTIIIVLIISFILIYLFVYNGNKNESTEEKLNIFQVGFVAFMLALIPTVVIGLSLFALLGSTSVINELFALQISTNQLILLAIAFFVYLLFFDDLIEFIVKYIIGDDLLHHAALLLIRATIFYWISALTSLPQSTRATTAIGVAVIILIIESLYRLREQQKEGT